jgi:hypothetical protein
MILEDDRTDDLKATHYWGVVGADRVLSGWGLARGGTSYACWACRPEDRRKVLAWVENRSDMRRVREVDLRTYRPRGRGHCHIYLVDEHHPARA